jgi:hypothetical protein
MRQNHIKLTRRNPIIAVLHLEITEIFLLNIYEKVNCQNVKTTFSVKEAFEKFNGNQKKLHSVLCSIKKYLNVSENGT